MFTVYKITNLLNSKIYIGVHKTDNPNDSYMGSGPLIVKAIAKYGIENFSKTILHIFETKEEAYQKESELVNEDFVKRKDTYNITKGGTGSWSHIDSSGDKNPMKRPEVVSKVIESGKITRASNKEFYDKISAMNWSVASENKKGSKLSKETKTKISLGINNFYLNNTSKLKGVEKSAEHKAAMSEGWSKKSREQQSERMKARIKENPDIVKTNLGKKFSKETRAKMSEASIIRNSKRAANIVECPHCGKSGVSANMKRWHFDKCKNRDDV